MLQIFLRNLWEIISYDIKPLENKKGKDSKYESLPFFSTQSRGRTGTTLLSLVFETNASTNSAIWAFVNWFAKIENLITQLAISKKNVKKSLNLVTRSASKNNNFVAN